MQRTWKRRNRRGAFTLLEVLLVLAILVVLTSAVGVGVISAQNRANKRAAQAQIGMIEQLINNYQLDVGSCPTTEQGLAALSTAPAGIPEGKWEGPYPQKALPPDPWGAPYQYESAGGDSFRIWSNGKDGQPGTGDDISSS